MQDGVILAWKGTYETNITFQLAATLKGHTHGITSLVVGGGNRLYSGSKDHTIRVSFSLQEFFPPAVVSFMLWVVSIWRELDYLRSLVLSSHYLLHLYWKDCGWIVSHLDLVLTFCFSDSVLFLFEISPFQILHRTKWCTLPHVFCRQQ